MEWKAEKWLFLVVFSDLENNTNSRSYGCSNKAKNPVLLTFRLGLLKNRTCWSSSQAGFGFYVKNYLGNDLQLFQNKTMQTCVMNSCRKIQKAGQNMKVLLESHDIRYSQVYHVFDYDTELRFPKFKMADSIWRTNFRKSSNLFETRQLKVFRSLITILTSDFENSKWRIQYGGLILKSHLIFWNSVFRSFEGRWLRNGI